MRYPNHIPKTKNRQRESFKKRGLLFLILAGVGFQLYRENYGKESLADRVTKLEEQVAQLQKEQETSNKIQTIIKPQIQIFKRFFCLFEYFFFEKFEKPYCIKFRK
jgi:cell division protein FtsB